MFTKKSLILGVALLLALVCAGTISTFAATATPKRHAVKHVTVQYWNRGIPAIPHYASNQTELLSSAEVTNYLLTHGFMGGSTLHGAPPVVNNLQLTNLTNLNQWQHILVPGVPLTTPVFFARLNGPFILDDRPPLTLLSILIPDSQTIPLFHVLHNLPILDGLTLQNGFADVGDFSGISNIANLGSLNGLTNGLGIERLLNTIFEIFDARTGNLLGWG